MKLIRSYYIGKMQQQRNIKFMFLKTKQTGWKLHQKKQEKKDAAMRNSLEIGDQVTTIGGVIGRVVAIKDDTFVLETGSDRVKIRFTKNAISSVEKLNMDNAPANAKK